MKNRKVLRKIVLLLFLPAGWFLSYITALTPEVTEKYYSRTVYKFFSQPLSTITGKIPFCLAEVITIALVLLISFRLIWLIIGRLVLRGKEGRNKEYSIAGYFLNLLAFLSILYFLFIGGWGLNYNRQPFGETAGLKVRPSSVEELESLCLKLIERANRLRLEVKEDSRGVMTVEGGYKEVLNSARIGYERAAALYPVLGGKYGNPKPLYFSRQMSYTGISGIYFPFTGEASININIPHCLLPSTVCHEMAHQRGFAREDEANYIAWVTCSSHYDPSFRYSGTLLAALHSLNALSKYDSEKASRLWDRYSEAVKRDLKALAEYGKKYEGKIQEISSDINDAYLKSNRQKDGTASYGRMVDLLLAEQRAEGAKVFLK